MAKYQVIFGIEVFVDISEDEPVKKIIEEARHILESKSEALISLAIVGEIWQIQRERIT